MKPPEQKWHTFQRALTTQIGALPFDLVNTCELCNEHGLWWIEDSCDALGLTYEGQRTGSLCDTATLSFYPLHHITTAEGGAVLIKSPLVKKQAESFRDSGRYCYSQHRRVNALKKGAGKPRLFFWTQGSGNVSRSVNLIMPVYRGDKYWEKALGSLAEARQLFDEVVISFDGSNRMQLKSEFRSSLHGKLADHLLVTPTTMSAVEHIAWILKQNPIKAWADDQIIMMLAEDDLICKDNLRDGLEVLKKNRKSLLFGSWGVDASDIHSKILMNSETNQIQVVSDKKISRQIESWAKQDKVTSISGMAFEIQALRGLLSLMSITRGQDIIFSGIRMEYFLATQHSVKALVRCSMPITLLQLHDQQESRILGSEIRIRDESLYQLSLVLTQQKMPLRERTMAFLRTTNWIIRSPSFLYILPKALRALRSSKGTRWF